MKKMRHSHGLRIALLAGASVVALAAAAPSAGAADMNKPMPMKAPPAPVAKNTWTWWIEGGAFNTAGDAFSIGPVISQAGARGISADNSAMVQRREPNHSTVQRLLLFPPEQPLLRLQAITRKYVTITG
jgi:hypothetical protein